MRRLFLDANVLFSAAHKPASAQGLLIEFAARVWIEIISSPYAVDEARRNLKRKSPHSGAAWAKIESTIQLASEPDHESLAWAGKLVVAKDAPILASAARAKVDWLVTGDRADFGALFLTTQRGMLVMPPSEAIRRLLDERSD